MLQKGKARVVGIHDQSISGNFSHILVSSIDHGDYENLNLLSVEEQQTKPITEFGNEYVILRWPRLYSSRLFEYDYITKQFYIVINALTNNFFRFNEISPSNYLKTSKSPARSPRIKKVLIRYCG